MNNEYSGYSHGYGGNTGQQQQAGGSGGYEYYQQQQQNQQQKYGYGDQAYTSYGASDYTATTTAAPHMGGGRADEYYNGGGEGKSYDNDYYPSEEGRDGEDGERGLKNAFVRTETDSYGMEHERYNKTNIALAAGAVAVGAYFLKRKFDKNKQAKEAQMMQQEIGDHYSMMDGKSQFGPGSYHPGGIPGGLPGGAPHPPPPAGNPYGGY